MLTFMNSKQPDKQPSEMVVLTNKTKFSEKVTDTDINIGEDLQFIIHVFYWCIPLYHEKHLT